MSPFCQCCRDYLPYPRKGLSPSAILAKSAPHSYIIPAQTLPGRLTPVSSSQCRRAGEPSRSRERPTTCPMARSTTGTVRTRLTRKRRVIALSSAGSSSSSSAVVVFDSRAMPQIGQESGPLEEPPGAWDRCIPCLPRLAAPFSPREKALSPGRRTGLDQREISQGSAGCRRNNSLRHVRAGNARHLRSHPCRRRDLSATLLKFFGRNLGLVPNAVELLHRDNSHDAISRHSDMGGVKYGGDYFISLGLFG